MPPGRNMERPTSAKFTALPPDLNVEGLIRTTPNFENVTRMDARNITASTMGTAEDYIYQQVIVKGLPLVITNWHLRSDWPSWIFNKQWLMENHGQARVLVRDIPNQDNIPMTFAHYLNNLGKLSSKFNPQSFDAGKQRLYGKDLDCPPVWRDTLAGLLPKSTCYLEPAADLMSFLPEHARAENMMCYIGHEGTYTPAHKEMCASLGHNIMVGASSHDNQITFRKGVEGTEGSSIWFMMSRDDRDVIAEYWLAQLGHDIEVENYFASLGDLAHAPFKVYIVEQKVGDYILVPPLAPHQVWNRGEYTIKAAWNRTTVDTLELAIKESLPKARLVCRDEQYKNRAIIYETLCRYYRILRHGNKPDSPDYIKDLRSKKTLAANFVRLFNLFNTILLDQSFADKAKDVNPKQVKKIDNEYCVSCSFCRANIWNRFLTCEHCITTNAEGEEEIFDVCIDCYARGRSCGCVSNLSWVEQEDWADLLLKHEDFRQMVIEIEGVMTSESPKAFYDALKALPRKTVGQVCDEQNHIRPFVDITKDPSEESEDDTKAIEYKKKTGQILNCHVCKVRHERWKQGVCTREGCKKAYCFGVLWRAFDMDPCDDVLVKKDWACPVCLGICSCGACQRGSKMKPYKPQGTFLGAATKDFTDPRGTEVLVDFSKGNLNWIKPGDYDTRTKSKRKRDDEEGEEDGMDMDSPSHASYPWGYSGADNDDGDDGQPAHIPIDPALAGSAVDADNIEDRDDYEEHPSIVQQNNHHHTQMDNQPSNDHNNPPSATEKIGGGQYLLSSSAHPSNMPPPHTTGDRHVASSPLPSDRYDTNGSYQQLPQFNQQQTTNQDIEMANYRLQSGEGERAYATTDSRGRRERGDASQQQRVTLPSPSAMLTGAQPRRISPETTSSHVSSHHSSHLNKHFHSPNTTLGNNTHTTYSSNDTDSHLSVLERNPIAFIAAAGLMQISHTHSSSDDFPQPASTSANHSMILATAPPSGNIYNAHPSASEVGTSGGALMIGSEGNEGNNGVDGSGAEDVNSRSNSYPSVYTTDSHHFTSLNSNTTPAFSTTLRYTPTVVNPNPAPVPAPLPPELLVPHPPYPAKGKRKSGFGASDSTLGASPATEIPYDGSKFSWVKQQTKLAKERERGKRYRKKSKIVKLKIPSERLQELEILWRERAGVQALVIGDTGQAIIPDEDLVKTDLLPGSALKPRRRGKLNPSFTAEDSPYHILKLESVLPQIPGSDHGDSDGSVEEVEVIPKKKNRRESAWVARRRQEWGEEEALIESQNATPSDVGSGKKRRSMGVSRNELQALVKTAKAIFDHGNAPENENAGSMEDGIYVEDDMPFPEVSEPPPRSESEIRRLEEEEEARKKEEEEKRKLEEIEAAKMKAEEEQLARIRAEEKEREEAQRRELEAERKHKAEIARAYAESKQFALKVATGEAPPDAWDDSASESSWDEGGLNDYGEQDWQDDDSEEMRRRLIPPGDEFAVVVLSLDSRWNPKDYDQFMDVDNDNLLQFEEAENYHEQSQEPSTTAKGRGRGRPNKKNQLTKSPRTSRRNSTVSLTNPTSTPAPPKSQRKPRPTGPDTAFRSGARPTRRRNKAASEDDEEGDDDTAKPPARKRARPSTKINTKQKPNAVPSSSPVTPVRTSTRQRKVLYSTLNYDDDADEDIGEADDDEELVKGDLDIDLEIDPDVGVLERERERLAKIREKRRRGRAFSRDPTVALKVGEDQHHDREKTHEAEADEQEVEGEGESEILPVVIEEAYNSRWRR